MGSTVTQGGGGGGLSDFQRFDVSGTWEKPSWVGPDTRIYVRLWGGGGGGGSTTAYGGNAHGGGGGSFIDGVFRAGDLPETVAVVVGAGGVTLANDPGTNGGQSEFHTLIAHGGGGGKDLPGSGGGYLGNANQNSTPIGGTRYDNNLTNVFSGGGGSRGVPRHSVFGGGGAGYANTGGQTSMLGGRGGAPGENGLAPAGGGGSDANGAPGRVEVWVG